MGEDESMPCEVVGLGARAPKASEARVVDAGATEVEMAEARARGSGQHHGAAGPDSCRGEFGPCPGLTRAPRVG